MFEFELSLNPAALEQADALGDVFIQAFTEECALQLYENLDASTSARTGVKYPGMPRVSSTPTQMPQEQEGTLQRMVDSGKIADGVGWWGLKPKTREEEAQARTQELGNPGAAFFGGVIARAPTLRTGFNSNTHRRAIEAGKRAVGSR